MGNTTRASVNAACEEMEGSHGVVVVVGGGEDRSTLESLFSKSLTSVAAHSATSLVCTSEMEGSNDVD